MEEYGSNINLNKFLKDLSSPRSAPGGGSAAALAGAIGMSLIIMVVNIEKKKKRIPSNFYKINYKKLEEMRSKLLKLFQDDSDVYSDFKNIKDINSEEAQELLEKSIYIPFNICEISKISNQIIKEIIKYARGGLLLDIDAALRFSETAFKISENNIKINIKNIMDAKIVIDITKQWNEEFSGVMKEFKGLKDKVNHKLKTISF